MSDVRKKDNFIFALAAFAFVCFIRHFKFTMSTYNTTFLALNYDYGFIPRGFVGTVFQFLTENCEKLEWNYMGAFNFSGLFTLVYFVLLFLFYGLCLHRCPLEHKRNLKHLLILLSVFAFPVYTTSVSFGCLDLYLGIITLLCLILFVWGKMEWLIPVLCCIGMCINHDFIFTHAMLPGALLIYKIVTTSKLNCIKYMLILAVSFLACATLFTHFDNYVYENPKEIVAELKPMAKELSETGLSYGKTYVREEILGDDLSLTQERLEQNEDNTQDLPVFMLLFSPYILGIIYLYYRMSSDKRADLKQQITYLLLLFGSICIIPMFIYDVYYGRYMFQLVFYYIAGFIMLFVVGDEIACSQFDQVKTTVKKLTPMTFVWFLYPFLLTPFRAVAISASIHKLAEILYTELTYFIQP